MRTGLKNPIGFLVIGIIGLATSMIVGLLVFDSCVPSLLRAPNRVHSLQLRYWVYPKGSGNVVVRVAAWPYDSKPHEELRVPGIKPIIVEWVRERASVCLVFPIIYRTDLGFRVINSNNTISVEDDVRESLLSDPILAPKLSESEKTAIQTGGDLVLDVVWIGVMLNGMLVLFAGVSTFGVVRVAIHVRASCRTRAGLCRCCGYALQWHMRRCPECGSAVVSQYDPDPMGHSR